MPRRRARRALTRKRSTYVMEKPQRAPSPTPPPSYHPHYFTRDTPHVWAPDGHPRPWRSPNSWHETENAIGWAEYQAGSGGGLGSDRHTERLNNGMGWAGAVALVLIPGMAFPPWLVIGAILLGLSALNAVLDALCARADRLDAEEAAREAYMAQIPHHAPPVEPAFGERPRTMSEREADARYIAGWAARKRED